MGKKKIVHLSQEQRKDLEKAYRQAKNHTFPQPCQMILLKAENRTSLEVTEILACCEAVVNNRLKRFETQGIKGLKTRAGRGQAPILSQHNPEHLQKVAEQIKLHPNSVKTVVAKPEEDLSLDVSTDTLKRFLKKMVTDSVERERGSSPGKWVKREPKRKNS